MPSLKADFAVAIRQHDRCMAVICANQMSFQSKSPDFTVSSASCSPGHRWTPSALPVESVPSGEGHTTQPLSGNGCAVSAHHRIWEAWPSGSVTPVARHPLFSRSPSITNFAPALMVTLLGPFPAQIDKNVAGRCSHHKTGPNDAGRGSGNLCGPGGGCRCHNSKPCRKQDRQSFHNSTPAIDFSQAAGCVSGSGHARPCPDRLRRTFAGYILANHSSTAFLASSLP